MHLTRKTKLSAKRRSKEAVRIVGGREICSQTPSGRAEYVRRRELRWKLDRGICCLCEQFVPLEYATTEHPRGRRDDRVEAIRIAHLNRDCPKWNYDDLNTRIDAECGMIYSNVRQKS